MNNLNDDEQSIDSFDFEKYNMDRDSVDTMELLKDDDEYENKKNLSDEDKTISSRSETIYSNVMSEYQTNENNKSSSTLGIEVNMNPIIENQLVPTTKCETFQTLNENSDSEIFIDDLVNMEEKLRDAWIKMRKLDKKLEKCCKQERMVKRETLALIEKNRAEIESLRIETNHKESKHEAENTAHFLALAYGDLDEEIKFDINNNEEDAPTPLFKTQLPYDCDNISMVDEEAYLNKPKENTSSINKKFTDGNRNKPVNDKNNLDAFSTSSKRKSTNNKQKYKPQNKAQTSDEKVNFIRRNIQLAQDSNGPLAMTEDEKLRLDELLIDTDQIDTKAIDTNNNQEISDLVEYNPFAVAVVPGDGFTPSEQEGNRLHEINSRLEKRLSRINSCINGSIGNSSRLGTISVMTKKSINSTNIIDSESYYGLKMETKQIKLNDEFDEEDFGDKFIREARVSREQELKLKQIEIQLERLKGNESQATNKSEIDMFSEKNSISTISLVNEKTIKELIEEYNFENSQSIQNNKLNTLKEEDSISSYSDVNYFDSDNGIVQVPIIHESILNSLIEDAKNEGIFVLEENRMMDDEPLHSYYDEAIEILNKKSNCNDDFMTEDYKEEEFVDRENKSNTYESTINNDKNKDDSEYKKSILPPLLCKTDNISWPEDDRPSSVSSINSTAYLPKIDSRFLPK